MTRVRPTEDPAAEYRLLTVWRLEAPLDDIYAAIHDSLHWPDWWPGVIEVATIADGDAEGVGNIRHYAWQGRLPYRVTFAVCTTRIEALTAIEGNACGDLEGTGRWNFSCQGPISIVRYEWHVRSTRWWMNLISPLARPLFVRNHAWVMSRGGEGLARRLGVRLTSQENIDLTAAAPPNAKRGSRWEGGRIDPAMALIAGIAAGVLATGAQVVLWWLAGMPLAATLLRDARLTAALLLGPSVLTPPSTLRWDILLVATLIHFALSVLYALLPAAVGGRLRQGEALVAGAAYGALIYAVNLYGLTYFFPWFAVARDWVTLAAHLVFGVALVGACRLYAGRR